MDLSLRHATESSSHASLPEARRETRPFLDAVIQALTQPRPSLDDVRAAVVRYGRSARELAIAADEMLASLAPRVRRALESMPSGRRTELLASVEWWAIHGYYGAD